MKNSSKEVSFEFKLPGFDKKNVKVKISKNLLSINADKKEENKIQKKDFFHKESIRRSFNYVTTLPNIESKKAKVNFEKGSLRIRAPKK